MNVTAAGSRGTERPFQLVQVALDLLQRQAGALDDLVEPDRLVLVGQQTADDLQLLFVCTPFISSKTVFKFIPPFIIRIENRSHASNIYLRRC